MIPFQVHSLVLILCLITTSLSSSSSSEAESPRLAKPGCKQRCGNVTVPYPFGIGPGCYFDEGFEIFCGNTTGKPFLRLQESKQELEVLRIEFETDTLVAINYPVTFFNCGPAKEFPVPVNLSGSPFVFSQDKNRFTAVSCDVLSVMKSAAENNKSVSKTIGACMSICASGTREANMCNGMNCCQTTIKSGLRLFFTDFELTARSGKCMYAFLVEQDWFQTSLPGRFSAVRGMDYVPVVLEWSLKNWTVKEFIKPSSVHYSTSLCRPDGFNNVSLRCFCEHGFEGNPYIHTCQDKNECNDRGYCEPEGICVNRFGGYRCYWPQRAKSTSKKVILGLSLGFGALFLIIASWCLHKILRKRKRVIQKQKFFKRNGGLLLQQQMSSGTVNTDNTKLFTSKELKKATDNFNVDRILGQGGQGTVYKGMLADGRIVAVKKSKVLDEEKIVGFVNEVVILAQINHRNVVKLLGCCLETEVPLLVYEFVPNGTLSGYIHHKNDDFPFSWEMRLRVATEIAGALYYLHYAASCPIFHRDIKSTNILLDEKYRAKIADFGTSKSLNIDQTHVTTAVHGTFGYLDPEYFQSNQFTEKSDVYSFGVILVELLTGQKAISMTRSQEGRSLATYFILSMKKDRLFEILDPKVMEGSKEEIMVVANIANRCLSLNGKNRPTMKEVTVELEGIKISEKASDVRQHYDELDDAIISIEQIEPWDVVSTSFARSSTFGDSSTSGDRRASLKLHELPLVSFSDS